MKLEIISNFKFTYEWLISLIARVFKETFDFIGEEEGWVEE